ncbi:PREDICTED: neuropeptide FF receptor 2-like [Papilio xuthus]|uniref:Neuropeptide FF receptor 2-like n=1 Tax=Papilio xuthus TaxID=66420 RepID=A0AAJ6ZRL4_PAPXU|nr:PREDICTED: neuropeptide FF receptor 2-like [Papilio xuthus]
MCLRTCVKNSYERCLIKRILVLRFNNFKYDERGIKSAELDILFRPERVLIALYVPIILLSLIANILLIVVAVKCNYTKNVTNIFLVNLSAADLLVTSICMPIQLSKAITLVWFYGDTVCKIVNYIQGVAVAASVFTLTAMSVDRWLSIAPEPRLRPPSRRQAMLLLGLLWVAAMLVFIPLLVVATVRREAVPIISKAANNISIETRDVHFCTEEWTGPETRKKFGTFSFTLVYAIPGSITILSYACMGRTLCSVRPPFDIDEGNVSMQQGIRLMKERKRVAWILLLLAVLFALCWLPYNIMQLLLDMNAVDPKHLSMYLPYALFIGHANSAINPIVYCLMTRNFQRSVRKLVCGRAACKQSKFTWRCNQKPERSSSDYELYHEPHKRCYIHMKTLRHNGETHGGLVVRDPRQTTQLSHVTRSSRRTAPAHLLSAEMLQRHGHIDLKR